MFVSYSIPELWVRLAHRETGLSSPVKYFSDSSKAVLLLLIFLRFFSVPLCAPFYMCLVVTCWGRADILTLVVVPYCVFVTFPLVSWVRQVWYLIVSISDLCTLAYSESRHHLKR